jgi:predicted metal-binding protein
VLYPSFKFGCGLDINASQTQAYLNPTCALSAGVLTDPICGTSPSWGSATIHCACDTNNWTLPADLVSGVPTANAAYSTPALDFADWYDVDIPESSRFKGFMVESIDGLDSSGSRSVTSRASSMGGGVLGSYRHKERRIKVTLLMFACDETSMEYGFRFLKHQLTSGGCDDCELCGAELRTSCPTLSDPPTVEELETGLWGLKNVGTIDGPKWMDPPIQGMSCFVRRVEFTIASEQPWLYKCPRFCTEEELLFDALADPCDLEAWMCEPAKVSCNVSESLIIGETAIGIEIHAREELNNVTIRVTPDTHGWVCDPASAPTTDIADQAASAEACALITLPIIPDGYIFRLDSSINRMTMTLPGGEVVDATPYISVEPGVAPEFISVSCGSFCVSVESIRCSPDAGDTTVSIFSEHREL